MLPFNRSEELDTSDEQIASGFKYPEKLDVFSHYLSHVKMNNKLRQFHSSLQEALAA